MVDYLNLDRNLCPDVGMRVVALDAYILVAEGEQVGHRRIEAQHRQLARQPRQLQPRLVEVVEIEMGIAEAVDEFPRGEPGDLRHHRGQQRRC